MKLKKLERGGMRNAEKRKLERKKGDLEEG